MAHPFFEVTRFPADRPDAIELRRVLSDAVRQSARVVAVYEQCAAGLPPLTLPMAVDILWSEALRNLTAAGVLQNLCNIIKGEFPNNTEIKKAILAVETAIPASKTKMVAGDILVLDRDPLRDNIDRIAPENATAKVLLVRGDSRSGKSHVRHLFILNAQEKGAEPIYLYSEIIPTLKLLLEQLFSPFAPEQPPPIDTTDPAWYQTVCTKLQALADKNKKVLWIAVDDLGEKNGAHLLVKPVRDFFEQFAMNMLNPFFRKSFRLMFIHFPSKIPTQWKKEIYLVNNVQESDIGTDDVQALLGEWRAKTGKGITDARITVIADEIIADAKKAYEEGVVAAQASVEKIDPPSRLELLHDLLTARLIKLEGEP